MEKQQRKLRTLEYLINIVLWILVFATPIVRDLIDNQFSWSDLRYHFSILLPFLFIFLVNCFILIPFLFFNKKLRIVYVIAVIGLTTLTFSLMDTWREYIKNQKLHANNTDSRSYRPSYPNNSTTRSKAFSDSIPPVDPDMGMGPANTNMGTPINPEMRPANPNMGMMPANPDMMPPLPDSVVNSQKLGRRSGNATSDQKANNRQNQLRTDAQPIKPPFQQRTDKGAQFFRVSSIYRWIIALLIIAFNLAIKLLFKSMQEHRKYEEWEKDRLQNELEYLKYQINPHFFMNTLNNIHALVDIDPKKAQDVILEFSKLMRYLLYDSSDQIVLLSKEIQFLQHYIDLMRIRYPNAISIETSFPESKDIPPKATIPPLLFLSFIENAFKHGVSFQQDSFVNIKIAVHDNQVWCFVTNSYFPKRTESSDAVSGIGLVNVKKRLELLFKDQYDLSIEHDDKTFHVRLTIPF